MRRNLSLEYGNIKYKAKMSVSLVHQNAAVFFRLTADAANRDAGNEQAAIYLLNYSKTLK